MTTLRKLPQSRPKNAAIDAQRVRRELVDSHHETSHRSCNLLANRRAMLMAVNADHPEPRKIARAVAMLEAGEVIAYPTDTVYGLGCDAMNKKAIDKPLRHQGHGPLASARVHLPGPQRHRALRDRREVPLPNPPPPLAGTVLLHPRRDARGPEDAPVEAARQIGIRVPAHEICLALTRALGRPLVSTTAQTAARRRESRTSIRARSTTRSRASRSCSTAARAASCRAPSSISRPRRPTSCAKARDRSTAHFVMLEIFSRLRAPDLVVRTAAPCRRCFESVPSWCALRLRPRITARVTTRSRRTTLGRSTRSIAGRRREHGARRGAARRRAARRRRRRRTCRSSSSRTTSAAASSSPRSTPRRRPST